MIATGPASSLPVQAGADFGADSLPQIVWAATSAGTFCYLNRHGLAYAGATGAQPALVIHPDEVERFTDRCADPALGEVPFELECRLRRSNGQWRWHTIRAAPALHPGNVTTRWVGTAADIEDAKQLEADLRSAQQETAETLALLEALYANAPIGLGFVDRDLRRVRANHMLAGLNGSTPDEQLGQPLAALVPAVWPQMEPHYRRVLATGRPSLGVEIVAASEADRAETRLWEVSYYPVQLAERIVGIGVVALDRTDEKTVELRNHQLSSLVEHSLAATVGADPRGLVTSWNAAGETMFGYSAAEMIGAPLSVLTPPGLEDEHAQMWSRIDLGGPPEHQELRRLRKDGTSVDVLCSASALSDGAGRVVGQVRVIQDITERVQAQRAERASERRLADAQRLAHVGSFDLDLATGELVWSAELYRILGLEPGGAAATEVYAAAVHPDDRAEFEASFTRVQEQGQRFDSTYRLRRPDGAQRWIHALGESEQDGTGTVLRITGTVQDITDRVEAERVRHEAEARFETAFEQGGIGAGILDLDGVPIRVNAAACALLGRPAEELINRSWDEYHHPDELPVGKAMAARGMTGKDTYSDDRRFLRPDGSIVWAQLHLTVVRDAAGEPECYLAQLQDITERRTLDTQREQTQRLTSLGQLAGGVAHDFNNLLGVILTYAALLVRRATDPTVIADLEEIRTAAGSGTALTRQLLTFARRDMATPQPIEINTVIRSVATMLERTLGDDILLRLDLDAAPLITIADRHQLEQIVLNLAINARDAMPGGGRLTITTELVPGQLAEPADDAPSSDIMLRVQDDGTGMAPDVVARAFEPFYSTKPDGEGTGLGLATVYGIVREQGGEVSIASIPGQGTAVTVILPATAQNQPAPTERPHATGGSGEQILLVEDREPLRRATARILTQDGYRVMTAADGAEALELYQRNRDSIDLVLTDVVMPRMRGDELARALAAEGAHVPIVFMSGFDSGADAAPLARLLLPKPVATDELLRAIWEVLHD